VQELERRFLVLVEQLHFLELVPQQELEEALV
jgi:hypothetical protein